MNKSSLSMPESLNRIKPLFIKYKFLCKKKFKKKKQTLVETIDNKLLMGLNEEQSGRGIF